MPKLQLVQDPAADALLDSSPFALLVGMLLDQPVSTKTDGALWLPRNGIQSPSCDTVEDHRH